MSCSNSDDIIELGDQILKYYSSILGFIPINNIYVNIFKSSLS